MRATVSRVRHDEAALRRIAAELRRLGVSRKPDGEPDLEEAASTIPAGKTAAQIANFFASFGSWPDETADAVRAIVEADRARYDHSSPK